MRATLLIETVGVAADASTNVVAPHHDDNGTTWHARTWTPRLRLRYAGVCGGVARPAYLGRTARCVRVASLTTTNIGKGTVGALHFLHFSSFSALCKASCERHFHLCIMVGGGRHFFNMAFCCAALLTVTRRAPCAAAYSRTSLGSLPRRFGPIYQLLTAAERGAVPFSSFSIYSTYTAHTWPVTISRHGVVCCWRALQTASNIPYLRLRRITRVTSLLAR